MTGDGLAAGEDDAADGGATTIELDEDSAVVIDVYDDRIDAPLFMFASGFAFGIALALLLLAIVGTAMDTGTVTVGELLSSPLSINLSAAALFCILVGSGLYFISFDRNRAMLVEKFGFD